MRFFRPGRCRPGLLAGLVALLVALLASAAHADVTIRLSTWEGDEALKIQRKAIADFEAAHPGIKVKLENNDYGVFYQKLLAQIASDRKSVV